jgi:hypothetical protein
MNAPLMTQYLEFVADRLVELGCDREYNTLIRLILWIWFHFKVKQTSWEKSGWIPKIRCMNTEVGAQKISFDADFN